MNVAHIGMGKTATTAFQMHVFPHLCRTHGLEYNPLLQEVKRQVLCNRLRLENPFLEQLESDLAATPRYLISFESLHGWDPSEWEYCADRNRELLGADCRIVVSIRDPRSYLTSVYLQMVHQGVVVAPEHFFVTSPSYSPHYKTSVFDVDRFSYRRGIDL